MVEDGGELFVTSGAASTIALFDFLYIMGIATCKRRSNIAAPEIIMAPGVRTESGIGTEDVPIPLLALGNDVLLTGEDTTTYGSGVRQFVGSETTVGMFITGQFVLSAGDRAILRGRFEFDSNLVPVESGSWGSVKALYDR